jgi:hypothetical protein
MTTTANDAANAYVRTHARGMGWTVQQQRSHGGAFMAGFDAGGKHPETAAPLVRAARDAERKRIRSILEHPEAQGRKELAQHLAYESDTTVDAAVALLKRAPVKGGILGLSEAMAREGITGPSISSQAPRDPAATAQINPERIFAARAEAARAKGTRPAG